MKLSLDNILIPVDPSNACKAAIKIGANLAKLTGAQAHLVNIKEKHPNLFGSNVTDQLDSLIDTHIQNLIREVEGNLHIKLNYIARSGGAIHKEIVSTAEEMNADMIVMGTHGVSGFQEFWLGSNAYRVVTDFKKPVITVQENFDKDHFNTIVLPIDSSKETRHKVPLTAALAKLHDATVHVYGVSGDSDNFTNNHIRSYVNQVVHYLEDHEVKYTSEVNTGGNITDKTIEYAKSVNADLIIIMTEQEVNSASLILGRYAQQMVNHSPIPVMSIEPREDLRSSYGNMGSTF